jgi:hypothetical protein
MRRGVQATFGIAAFLAAAELATAADMPINAAKLVIKRSSSGIEKLVFISTDASALFPFIGGADDPISGTPGGTTITLISDVEGAGTLAIESGTSDLGWSTKFGSVSSYRYDNADAPAGASRVRSIVFREGRIIKIVARSTALPMMSAHGSLGVRIETGSLRNCALFTPSTIIANTPRRFIAVNATAASLSDCSSESLGKVPACGDGVPDLGEECDSDQQCAAGEACSSSCTCIDAACPDTMQLTIHAGAGVLSTATELDFGSSGIEHDADYLDQNPLALRFAAFTGAAPACGEATVAGIDAGAGNCRCANDNHVHCDEPFADDEDDCGGAYCACYFQPPHPISAGNTPYCVLWKLRKDVTGTWNVDSGEGEIALSTRNVLYLGEGLTFPCPTCEGDTTLNDGVRDGACFLGDDDGEACDANATDASFPPGGGAYSYDCLPNSGKNVSGTGMIMKAAYTTGTSALPPAALPCMFGDTRSCPCGSCSLDVGTPCSSDADCAPDAGVCQKYSTLEPSPNSCSGECVDAGGGEGQCDPGPVDRGCDGITRANGDPLIQCASNGDCAAENIGVAAGKCTLSKTRECFLDPVAATGTASQAEPVIVASFCGPHTNKTSFNNLSGFPGPVRSKIAMSTAFRCVGNPAALYPGCP